MSAGGAARPPPPPPPARGLLVVGPAGSGRSALLFRAALAAAAPPGRVLFLAPRPLQRLPGGGGGPVAAPAGALQRIQFRYPASLRELLRLLAALHETRPAGGGGPSLLVLDGLEEYLARGAGPPAAAQLAALLLDTAHHYGGQGGPEPAGCRLMAALRFPGEGADGAERLSAVGRYFGAQCWLHPEAPEGGPADGRGAAKLVRARLAQPGSDGREWLLRFEPREEMEISPLPCPGEGGASARREGPPVGDTPRLLDLWGSSA